MTRTACWCIAVLAAACGDVNADVVVTKKTEPAHSSAAVAPRSDQTESDAGDRTDHARSRAECRIDEDCTRGENPKCVSGQCVH